MNRKEAVDLLKIILIRCKMPIDSFSIIEPQVESENEGYSIQIKGFLDSECLDYIRKLAGSNGLKIKQDQNKLIIYRNRNIIVSSI